LVVPLIGVVLCMAKSNERAGRGTKSFTLPADREFEVRLAEVRFSRNRDQKLLHFIRPPRWGLVNGWFNEPGRRLSLRPAV
jgi:hypothetical protein